MDRDWVRCLILWQNWGVWNPTSRCWAHGHHRWSFTKHTVHQWNCLSQDVVMPKHYVSSQSNWKSSQKTIGIIKTKILPFVYEKSHPQMITHKDRTSRKPHAMLALFLRFPVCGYFWPILIDFPLTQTLHSPSCQRGLGELMGKRNTEKAGQVTVSWNGHSCYSTLPKAVQFIIHLSTSTAFTNRNYQMWLQFHFVPWVWKLG